jgi:hypothetical protein
MRRCLFWGTELECGHSERGLTLMFLPPVKIPVTTLVVVFLLLASGNANSFAQQNRNSARLEVPHVTLSASPTSVAPGRRVRLVAHLASGYPNIRFRFGFGDGTESSWQTSTITTHTYQAPGNYLPYVDIGVATGAGVTRLGGSPRARIHVTQTSPGLYVSPATIGTGRPVTFNPRSSNVRTGSATVVRTPAAAGRRATTGVRGRQSTRTTPEKTAVKTSPAKSHSSPSRPNISASSSPMPRSSSPATKPPPALSTSPDSSDAAQSVVSSEQASGNWWQYLVLALPLALVALVLGKKYLGSRTTIRTFADPGTANVTDASGLVVDSRLDRRPNVLHGEHIVSSDDASLVKNVRREDV